MSDRNGKQLNAGDEVLLRGPKEDDAALVGIIEELPENRYRVRWVDEASAWALAELPLHDAAIDAGWPAVEAGRAIHDESFIVAGSQLEAFEFDGDEDD